jgi:hypothetical protein
MIKPVIKLIRFLGWLIVIIGLLLTIVFFFMLIEKGMPTSSRITAIVCMAIFGVLAFLGFRLARFKKKQEKEQVTQIPIKNHLEAKKSDDEPLNNEVLKVSSSEVSNTENEKNAVNVNYSIPAKNKPNQNIGLHGKVNYKPFWELCAETENATENDYTPFDPFIPVSIVYRDRDGETTKRDIEVIYIAKSDYDENYYFKAFCHLRNEDRTFNVERIQQAIVDGNTVDFIQYIVDTYRNTDKYKQTLLTVKTRKILYSDDVIGYSAKILTYISRIDGIFTRKEKTQVAAFIKELAVDYPDIEIENYVDELADLNPTTPEYKAVIKNADITENLIKKAKEIAGKDPLRLGAIEILNKQYEKKKKKN